ncbi:MAG: SDR family NAD(P)-dependent oxidoreductase [Candidatus Nitrosocosmicus sp.]|jgi:NAD(P)-dependent dehydrogenase (short-subunit alcohol dehydrogenase family)|nr:SDR family oxidoreductase [Candidatus Nitrosocosmicus sp.]
MSLHSESNPVAIITGSSQGIGKSLVKDFLDSGYKVFINSSDEHALKDMVTDISSTEGDTDNISYFVGDISENGFADKLIEEVIKKWGRLDVLINNGKITNNPKITSDEECIPENKIQQLQQPSSYSIPEEYQTSDPLIRGIYYCIKAAVTRKLSDNDDGNLSIINISSCQGCLTQETVNSFTEFNFGVDPYVDSMARIESLTKSIALELADRGIRVNGIVPGLVFDDMNQEIINDIDRRKYEGSKVPLRRIGMPHEISKVALFLASDGASYITGSMIPVDGGLTLKRPNYYAEVLY